MENRNNEVVKVEEKKNLNIFVKGSVGFYGKVKPIKGKEKVFRLTIENPEFRNLSEEALTAMYDGEKWKDNSFLSEAVKGNNIECFMVHSSYPVESIFFKGKKMSVDDFEEEFHEEFSLNEAFIEMKINKGYIGKINLIKNGKPYNPFE